MPVKRKVGGRKIRVGAGRKRGKGFFSKIGNAFKSAGNWVKDQAVKQAPAIAKVVKDNKLVSQALNAASSAGVPGAAGAAALASKAGYGRKRMGGRGKLLNENTKVLLM